MEVGALVANASDRALFLETIKSEPMTVNDIIHRFGVARNTARAWVNHSEVEQIIGSYPKQYKRKNSYAEEMPVTTKKEKQKSNSSEIVELPFVTTEQKETFFRSLLANEPESQFNFTKEFREAETLDNLKSLEYKLISSLIVTRYYRQLMTEYEESFED